MIISAYNGDELDTENHNSKAFVLDMEIAKIKWRPYRIGGTGRKVPGVAVGIRETIQNVEAATNLKICIEKFGEGDICYPAQTIGEDTMSSFKTSLKGETE